MGGPDSHENVIKLVGGGVVQICQEVVSDILEKQAKNCFSRVGWFLRNARSLLEKAF